VFWRGLSARVSLLLEADRVRRFSSDFNGGKAGRSQAACGAILLLGQFELAVADAERDLAAPRERLSALHDHAALAVHGLGIAVNRERLAAQIGADALAGRHAVPAAGDDRAHLGHADGRHHRIWGVVAPDEA